jgi:hypothetical protein
MINSLPTYDSIASCASSTGIPLRILKHAKQSGCPAFKGSRVYLDKLLPWLFQNDNGDNKDHGEEFKKWRAAIEKQKFQKRAEELVSREDVASSIYEILGPADQIIENAFCSELPAKMAGLDAAKAREEGMKIADQLRRQLRELECKWK